MNPDNDVINCIVLICKHLKSLRDAIELTQDDLAKIVGVTRQSIIGFEHQERKLSRSILISIITFFTLDYRSATICKNMGLYENNFVKSLGFSNELVEFILDMQGRNKSEKN